MKVKVMTKQEFKVRLDTIASNDDGDIELSHCAVDDLMVEALTSMGYDCSARDDMTMWYA